MKDKHSHIFTVLLLLVYFAFSSGIAITVHHCCDHCREYVEYQHCDSSGHKDKCDLESNKDTHPHHHAHDTFYFFKIADFHKSSLSLSPASWQWVQTAEDAFLCEQSCDASLEASLKENIFIPSFFHLQGNHLLDFLHQRVFYS